MTEDRLSLGQALGSCKQHEFTGQYLGQLRTGIARVACDRAQAQRKYCGQHGLKDRPCEVRITRLHTQREPGKLEAEYVLNDQRQNDGGQRDQQNDKDVDELVLPLVLFQRSQNTQCQTDGYTDQR